MVFSGVVNTVPDPELEIGGGGSGYPDPEIRGRAGLPQFFFRPVGHQYGLKIRGTAPPGPSPASATAIIKR